jgi:hypothetical protein
VNLLPLPTFLIIGAQKSGTRWLRHNLGRHPEVFTADREIEFFNHHFAEGPGWYRRQFVGWTGQRLVGEATPGYSFHRDDPLVNAGRVHAVLGPDVRIVAILRDPVQRARSAYLHHLRHGNIDPDADMVEYLRVLDPVADPLGLISGGWYGRSLQPYVDRFGNGVRVEFHDDAQKGPADVVLRVLHHIGVEDDWEPEGADEVRNAGVDQTSRKFPDHPALAVSAEDLRPMLHAHFEEDTAWLESIIDRPVPWAHEMTAP